MAFWRVSFALLLALGAIRADGDCNCGCPSLWTRYRGNCYRLFGQAKSWFDAEEHCKEFLSRFGQGHLTSIHCEDENNFILELKRSTLPHHASLWLGATDQDEEGIFIWTDGTVFDYQSWKPGQPSHGNLENYLGYWDDQWNDAVASQEKRYICKMPGGE